MEKRTENISKKLLLYFKEDIATDDELKLKLKSIDDKVQQMLLWSTLCSVWSYLILIISIARIYSSFKGVHTLMLIGSLISMYLLMGILIYFVWKGMTYKRSYFYYANKTYLKYQLNKLSAQRKLISLYLVEYAVLLGVASIFFFRDINHGLSYLLKITAPVSFITYVIGLYFISNSTKQIKSLELVHRQINDLYVKSINSN
ncbi:hypothetical protein [Mucilaginibacter sp.]